MNDPNRFAAFDVAELQMLVLGLSYVSDNTMSWRGHPKFEALSREAQAALIDVAAEEEDD